MGKRKHNSRRRSRSKRRGGKSNNISEKQKTANDILEKFKEMKNTLTGLSQENKERIKQIFGKDNLKNKTWILNQLKKRNYP